MIEESADVNMSERTVTALHKPNATEVNVKDNFLSNQIKENFTVKADDSFSEQLGEKIDLLIKNNQREAKISCSSEWVRLSPPFPATRNFLPTPDDWS